MKATIPETQGAILFWIGITLMLLASLLALWKSF
jgi:hypothetical protein